MRGRRRPPLPGPTRRSVLGGAGALALGLGLSACSRESPQVAGASPAADRSQSEPVVRWANRPLYLDYDPDSQTRPSVEAFQERAQIQVAYAEEIGDNQKYYDMIEPKLSTGQDFGRDLIVVSDWLAALLLRQGYAQKLDKTSAFNWENILPRLKNPEFDPGRVYSLTWQSGFTGIAWNKDETSDMTQLSDLWRPELKGRVQVLSELRDTMGLIMLDQRVDIEGDFGSDRFGDALAELEGRLSSGQIGQVTGASYTDDLVSEKALACIAWSGDIAQLNEQHGDKWGFALPEAGATLWSDDLMIPIGSPHKQNAEILINYFYDPKVAAQVAGAIHYISPVTGARSQMERVNADLVDDPMIFPSNEDLDRASTFRQFTPAEQAQFATDFASVVGG